MTLKKLLQLFCVSKKDSKKKGDVAFLGLVISSAIYLVELLIVFLHSFFYEPLIAQIWVWCHDMAI